MINIIKLTDDYDMGLHTDTMDVDIKYFNKINIGDLFETIQDLNRKINNKDLLESDILLNYAKGKEDELFENLKDDDTIIDFIENEGLRSFQDLLDGGLTYEIMEFLEYQLEDLDLLYDEIALSNNCKFGRVGYSQWAYYIAYKDVDFNFINDLWEGYNFYNITLIKDNDIIDSISGCYIQDEEDLNNFVLDYFDIKEDDFLLVDNLESNYFDIKKVREVETTSYSYELID